MKKTSILLLITLQIYVRSPIFIATHHVINSFSKYFNPNNFSLQECPTIIL